MKKMTPVELHSKINKISMFLNCSSKAKLEQIRNYPTLQLILVEFIEVRCGKTFSNSRIFRENK